MLNKRTHYDLECDTPGCSEVWAGGTDLDTVADDARKGGWSRTTATCCGQHRDYCPDHMGRARLAGLI
jgi:hypothetical protein